MRNFGFLPLQRAIAISACVIGVIPNAHANDAASAMIVLDGSGSMWARFDAEKRAKIDVVRDQLTAALQSNTTNRIGLTSFGHRRRGNCGDVEIISAPDVSRTTTLDAVAKLNPRGKGPMVSALRETIAALGTERPASIILISDGPDNCQQDACAAASEFAASTPGVAIHTIAIGVPTQDQPRLACIAKTTGGTFFDATDTPSLVTAIDKAFEAALLTPGKSAVSSSGTQNAPAPPVGASLRATLALAEGGEVLAIPAKWRIYVSGGVTPLAESEGTEVSAKLDPGTYDIEADTGKTRTRQTVTIEDGRALGLVMPLKAGRINVRVSGAKDGAVSQSAVISITKSDASAATAPIAITHGGQTELVLPEGTYSISVKDGSVSQSQTLNLDAGAIKQIDVVLGAGHLELSSSLGDDASPLQDVTYIVAEDDPDSPDGRREVARSRSATAHFTLTAGTYYVSARSGNGTIRERIALGAGEVVKRTLALPLSTITISTRVGGEAARESLGLVTRITELDGDKREISRSLNSIVTASLPPGRYRIAAYIDAHHLTAEQDITVDRGKNFDVVLNIEAAEISFKTSAVGFVVSESYWEVLDATGDTVWRSLAHTPKTILQPGRYTVKHESRDRRQEAAFEVKSGQSQTIDLGIQ
jgi:Ca-activated chloride channel family protein